VIQRSEKVSLDPPVGEMDHVRGVEVAPVTLVEYGDYECPLPLFVGGSETGGGIVARCMPE